MKAPAKKTCPDCGALRSGKGACRGGIRCEIRQTPGIVERERLARVGDFHVFFRKLRAQDLVPLRNLVTDVALRGRGAGRGYREEPRYTLYAPAWATTLNERLLMCNTDARMRVFRAFVALPDERRAAALTVLELGNTEQFCAAVGVIVKAWAA